MTMQAVRNEGSRLYNRPASAIDGLSPVDRTDTDSALRATCNKQPMLANVTAHKFYLGHLSISLHNAL